MAFSLSLVTVELGSRWVRRTDPLTLAMGHPDARYHHTLPPDSVFRLISSRPGEYDVTAHINQYGFRGPNLAMTKGEGQKRIFIAGDSFVFGAGSQDEETIPAFLQKILDPSRRTAEIVNLGIPSYSPLTHYLRLRDEIPRFKPDLVVMFLDFSDLRDDWDVEKTLLYDKAGRVTGSNPYYEYGRFRLWNFLRAKSFLCLYLHNKVVRTFQKIQKLGLTEYLLIKITGKRAKAVIANREANAIEFDGRLFMRGRAKEKEIRHHFQRTAKYILLSRDLARDYRAQFILVMYPYGIYVGPDQWKEGRVFWGFEQNKVYTDLFAFELVGEFARENEIPFINLLDDFVAHKDEPLFFPFDGHFTSRANEIAAEALAKHPIFQQALSRIR